MEFKDFFNTYDTVGTQHTGFLQSMDFSALTGSVTFLNELTMAFMDAYLYNELSGSLVMRQWGQYMHYSRENERFEVMASFYQDFVNALTAKLMRAEKWYQLTKIDFQSLSATDIKTIEHGTKETDMDYGQAQKTRVYGQDQTTDQYGQEQKTNVYGQDQTSTQYGQTQKTSVHGAQVEQNEYAQQQDTTVLGAGTQTKEYGQTTLTKGYGSKVIKKDYDRVIVEVSHDGNDSHVIGQAHTATSNTVTNKLFPLGASDFVNDTQNITSGTTDANAQTNTDTWADVTTDTTARADKETTQAYTDTENNALHTDVVRDAEKTDRTTHGAHTDVKTNAAYTDTLTDAQHTDTTTRTTRTDTETDAQHTDTHTRATRTDTETDGAKKDTQTIKAYTDTERHTKHIIISPEKYYAIEKELADIGVYELMKDAVRETMLLCVWEGGYIW